ncbi:DEAD/DEAH box helicase [Proteiniclasticum sp. BAD-10]|uniref:DEAD/DEAH box helicase n=1 Tax=Proteiniclasticum sediminis TaxID=2804028 RepID=A0A941CPI2_9CLOT|nr:DEAD/DEAH box helicase [Proteiniclasticum sediminis]MBR0575694.1 DEAD/DEAH box helicase [Proteiniclasticum sediminis]
MKFVPHDYQKTALDHVIKNPAAGLLLDMGMGKTVTTLTAVDQLMNDYLEVDKVLVIAPLRVAEDTWSRETEKWDHLKHLKIAKILGPEKQRLAALQEEADIYIINRENTEWLVSTLGLKWDFDMVVIDELSSFKSHTSKRFKALKKVRPLIKRIVGLTGTPAPNGYMDIWAEVYLLDRGERLGKNITAYRQEYFYTVQRPGFQLYKIREGSEQRINDQIKDICISMKAKDYLKLKEPLYINVPAALSKEELQTYREMEKDAILQLEEGTITALNAAAVAGKLLQIANGAVYDTDGNYIRIHDRKLDVLEDLVEAANGKPVLVFYSFKHDLARIQERFPKAQKLETAEDIKNWNAGKVPIMLAHPASTGHGLNLQDGGNIIIWYGLNWSLELYQQANARLHRQGQTEGVIIHHIIAEGTIDERVLQVLQGKNNRQDALLDALKAMKTELEGGKG